MYSMKYNFSMVLLVLSSVGSAGQMSDTVSETSVPKKVTTWDIEGGAIFFKPSINDMRDTNARTVTMSTGQTSVWARSIDYSWGFFLDGSYHYTANNDIHLNWYHLRAPFSNTYQNLAGTFTTIDMNPQWDAANLEFGKQIALDEQDKLRLHAGIQYGRVSVGVTELNSTSTVNGVELLSPVSLRGTPTYNGVGPRFGIDLAHHWQNGFNVYGNIAAAVLAGTGKYSKTFTYDVGVVKVQNASSTLVVPEIDTKLGARYTHALQTGQVTLDVGWMLFDYWNVLNTADVANISEVETTNFAAQGPYIGIKWTGVGV